MPIKYIDSIEALKSKYPNTTPLESGKNRIHHGRQYTNIGTEKKSHGGGWQFGRTIMAAALSSLLVPLAFKKSREFTGRLWKEGSSGSEKISLYFNSNDLSALKTYVDRKKALDSVRKNGDNYPQIDPKHRDDEAILIEAIKTASTNLLPFASPRLQESRTVALALVQKNGDNFQHLSNTLRDDEAILLEAIKNTYANLLPHASPRLQESRRVALALVRKNGDNFKHLSHTLRDDEEVFLEASKATVANLLPFTNRLRESKSLALKLVTKFAPNYERLSENMKKEKEVALAACKYYDRVMDVLNRDPSQKGWAQENLSKLREIYNLMPDNLKNDTEIKASYKKNKKALKAYINKPEPVVQHVTIHHPTPVYHYTTYQPEPVYIPTPVFYPIPRPRPRPVPVHYPVARPVPRHVPVHYPVARPMPMHHHVPHRPARPHHTHTPVRTFR